MQGISRRATILGLIFFAAPGAIAGAEKATRLETARWASGLNAKSAAGREWIERTQPVIDKLITPVLGQCLPDDGEELTAFSIFMRLSREGHIREV